MGEADAPALPFPAGTAWILAGVMALTGPLVQVLAQEEAGLHPYMWATVVLAPSLALGALVGRRHAQAASWIVLVGAAAASAATAWINPVPVPSGLLRPVAALPPFIAAAVVPEPRFVAGIGVVGLVATWIASPDAEVTALTATLVAQAAAAAIAVGLAVGWRDGRTAAMHVGRLHAEVERTQAERAALRRFLQRAAHELRTPLVPLRLLPARMVGEQDEERRREIARRIDARVAYMARLLDRMGTLGVTSAEAGVGRADLETEVRARVDDDRITVRVPSDAVVAFHTEALGLIIDELLANAKEHARGRIMVWTEEAENAWVLHVEDDGPGIPEAERASLVEPFARVDRDLPPQSGTGLGLSIAHAMVLDAGGSMALAAGRWGGLDVVLNLPRADGHEAHRRTG